MFKYLDGALMGIRSRASHATDLKGLLMIFANVVVVIAVAVSLAAIAFSFVQFITSMGNPKAVDKAKTSLTWAVIGMIVAAGAYGFSRVFLTMAGVSEIPF